MKVHQGYERARRRIYVAGGLAIGAGVLGAALPIVPGTLLILSGLSILSLQSRIAHQFLARLRARHPDIGASIERAEAYLFKLFNLRTHGHEYAIVPGRDGKTIAALIERSELGAGVAVVLHSASMVMEAPATAVIAEAMRARGLTVVRFDAYHGMGESGGPFASFTPTNFMEDLEDVLTWARAQTWWRGPLVLAGHSVGGLIAARYAELHESEVSELYLIAPNVSGASYEAAYKQIDPDGFAAWERDGIRTVPQPLSDELFGIGFSFVEDMRRYDLMSEVHKLAMPLHVYVGDHDTVSPERDLRAFVEAAGAHASLMLMRGVRHVPKHHDELLTLRDALMHGE